VKWRALAALLLIASCSRPAAKPPAASNDPNQLPTDIINEQSSLLDITRGATIVSRTGENLLLTSALNTIDGDIGTYWQSPPHDFPQSIVIGLGAPSNIDRVGIRSLAQYGFVAGRVTFETSLDGNTWSRLTTITASEVREGQWWDVPSAKASYLRVTIPAPSTKAHDVRLHSIYAHGAEIAPRIDPRIDGCWSVNGSAAAFVQHAAHATGVLARGAQPVFLDGATNGRLWRFNWIRGNDFGFAALTIAQDGKHLNAIEWHEQAIPLFRSAALFGERATCAAPAPRDDVPLAVLHRAGRVSLFALQFDATGQLDANASREALQSILAIARVAPPVVLVAHEFRQTDARRNKELAQREIDSLKAALIPLGADLSRISFLAAGSDNPRHIPETDVARAIYSSVEMEVRR
jgi:hypothetical protein